MRMVTYVWASLALLFSAGRLIACPAIVPPALLCTVPLDTIEDGDGFSIVARKSQPQPSAVPAIRLNRLGNHVWIDDAPGQFGGHLAPIFLRQESVR